VLEEAEVEEATLEALAVEESKEILQVQLNKPLLQKRKRTLLKK